MGGCGRQLRLAEDLPAMAARAWHPAPSRSSTSPTTGAVPTSTITQSTLPTINTTTANGGKLGRSRRLTSCATARPAATSSVTWATSSPSWTFPSFSATVRFLNEDSDAEFLANPRIVTADNLEATIKIVRNQPVPQLNFNEQTATAVFGGFQDKIYGSTLVVKPSINKDDFITMSVKPEISNHVADQVFNFAGASGQQPGHRHAHARSQRADKERLHAGHRRPLAGSGDQGHYQGADSRRYSHHRLPVPGASQLPAPSVTCSSS